MKCVALYSVSRPHDNTMYMTPKEAQGLEWSGTKRVEVMLLAKLKV